MNPKKSNKNGYNRASSMMNAKNTANVNRTAVVNRPKTINNMPKTNLTKPENKSSEMPRSLRNDLKVDGKDEISIEKTNDILKQINEYLDEEKKKLK